jgi:hypothetical protein
MFKKAIFYYYLVVISFVCMNNALSNNNDTQSELNQFKSILSKITLLEIKLKISILR